MVAHSAATTVTVAADAITTATASSASYSVTVASATGIQVGAYVTAAAGIAANTYVVSISGTTVYLSVATNAVMSATNIFFTNIAINQYVSGTGILPETRVTAIAGTTSPITITLSQAPVCSVVSQNLEFYVNKRVQITNGSPLASVHVPNTGLEGTGTYEGDIFLAIRGGTFGTRIDQILIRHLGTNVATVLRFFMNSDAVDATTSAGGILVHELAIAANTLSTTAASTLYDVTITKNTTETAVPIPYVPAGMNLYIANPTSINAGLEVTVHAADY